MMESTQAPLQQPLTLRSIEHRPFLQSVWNLKSLGLFLPTPRKFLNRHETGLPAIPVNPLPEEFLLIIVHLPGNLRLDPTLPILYQLHVHVHAWHLERNIVLILCKTTGRSFHVPGQDSQPLQVGSQHSLIAPMLFLDLKQLLRSDGHPFRFPHPGNTGSLAGGRPHHLLQIPLDRPPGSEPDQHEDQKGDPEQRQRHKEKTPEKIYLHRRGPRRTDRCPVLASRWDESSLRKIHPGNGNIFPQKNDQSGKELCQGHGICRNVFPDAGTRSLRPCPAGCAHDPMWSPDHCRQTRLKVTDNAYHQHPLPPGSCPFYRRVQAR